MSNFDYENQAQIFYSQAPVIILGSGASAAHGLPGMGVLSQYLVTHTDTSDLDSDEMSVWKIFCAVLEGGTDLESALHKVAVSEKITKKIIKSTWMLINSEDINVFKKSLENKDMFPLSRFLVHMFRSSLKTINVVTTNYDRLAEYACDQSHIHHFTGFTHGFFRQLAMPDEIKASRQVNIWKVHGSIDWFQSPLDDTIALASSCEIPKNHEPQIVTPGIQKYQKTHLEPFRSIINHADQAINTASSYLCIGYGFNDEHIQPKLMAKCIRQNTPITIITYQLSESAKRLILGSNAKNYMAIERGATNDQSIIYSSLGKDPLTVEKNIWSLEGYLSLIM